MSSQPGTGRLRRACVVLIAAVALAATIPLTVSAGGQGSTIVQGIQHAYGTCGNGTGYLMTGDLQGCWWIDTAIEGPSRGTALIRGTEHFTGSIGSRYGTFYTTYTFTAQFDDETGAELHGRCHHPVVGGEGDFAGISGVLTFKDVVDVIPNYYPYRGTLRLAGGAGTLSIAVAPSTANAAASATAKTPC